MLMIEDLIKDKKKERKEKIQPFQLCGPFGLQILLKYQGVIGM